MRAPEIPSSWLWVSVLYVVVRTPFRYFITGRPIWGKPKDNATFTHAATKDLSGSPVEKLSGPKWQRLARRWLALGVPIQLAIWFGREWALYWWVTAGLAVLAWAVASLENWIVNRKSINEYVYPTWKAVTDTLGVPYHKRDARKNVKLPPGFIPPDAEITEPGQHGRLSRWTGVAWLMDKWALRKLLAEAERIKIEAAREAESTAEPEPGTELAIPAQPGQFALYRERVVHAFKPQPREETEDEAPVRIYLPKSIGVESVKSNLIKNIGPVLGMGVDPIPSWAQRGSRPYVELVPRRLPPKAVGLAEMRKWIDQATLTRIPLGLDAYNRPVWLDLDNNSPHWMVSAGSGAGKSKFIMAAEAIRMSFGVATIFVDFKRISHRWAHGLKGSVYAWRIEECHDVLTLVGQELIRRINDVLPDDATADTPMAQFAEIDVIIEEANSLIPMLADHWKEIRATYRPPHLGPDDRWDPRDNPITSPAITAIKQGINMGREFRIHMVYAAQRASAATFGAHGGDARESLSFRILGKWSMQAWRILAGGIPYLRPPKGGRGIFAVIDDEDHATIIRAPLLTDAEAIALANSGVPCPLSPMGPESIPADPEAVPEPEAIPAAITLRAAAQHLDIDYKALRNAKDRDKTFPKAVGMDGASMTFDYAALVEWKTARDERARRPLVPVGDGGPGAKVYRIDTWNPELGEIECGYIGQTWREIKLRGEEHWGDKPWGDLVVGSIYVIWEGPPDCTQPELDAMELELIEALMPRYNYKGQEGAHWAVPLHEQPKQRWERDRAAGRPLWKPRDVYTEREAEEAEEVAAVTRPFTHD
jgi:hypothetical protein